VPGKVFARHSIKNYANLIGTHTFSAERFHTWSLHMLLCSNLKQHFVRLMQPTSICMLRLIHSADHHFGYC